MLDFMLGLAFPNAPRWLAPALSVMLLAAIHAVRTLEDSELTPDQRREQVLIILRKEVDAHFDEYWPDMSEARRDRILLGLCEVVLLVLRTADSRSDLIPVKPPVGPVAQKLLDKVPRKRGGKQ